MSSLTNDWIQNISHNKVRSFIFIDNFKEKMKEYSVNEKIRSEPFLVNKSRFALDIYPNGDDVKGHVSAFLVNLNNWRVCINYKFSVPEIACEKRGAEKTLFDSSVDWGWAKFLPHNQRSKWLSNDSLLKIVVDVELLCEEIPMKKRDEVLTLQNTDFQIEKPVNTLEGLRSFVSEKNQILMKENENLRSMVLRLTSKSENLESMVSSLTLSVGQLTEIVLDQKDDVLRIEWPECPICHERIKKPMRLKQCGKGHIVCEECLRGETNCYTCKDVISGRPTALEHILNL